MTETANGLPVIAPLRNAARQVVAQLPEASQLIMVAPMRYLEFGWLTAHAKAVITDSGNVAEEATWNGVPCITLNSYTEHIETVKVGSNVLVGENAQLLGDAICDMVNGRWKECALPERWDGRTAERIVQILLERRHLVESNERGDII
jgi:UDP-N-acetylglucosamine 2-epimerase (non-hydrolysing)